MNLNTLKKNEETINTPFLTIDQNVIILKDKIIQISNICSVESTPMPKKKSYILSISLLCIGLFFFYQGFGTSSNKTSEFMYSIISLIMIVYGLYLIVYAYQFNMKRTNYLTFHLNSSWAYFITCKELWFIEKLVGVITYCMNNSTPKVIANLETNNFTNCNVIGEGSEVTTIEKKNTYNMNDNVIHGDVNNIGEVHGNVNKHTGDVIHGGIIQGGNRGDVIHGDNKGDIFHGNNHGSIVTGDMSNSNFAGRDGSFQTTNTNIQNKWNILVRELTDLHNKLPLDSEERKVVSQAINYSKNKDNKKLKTFIKENAHIFKSNVLTNLASSALFNFIHGILN